MRRGFLFVQKCQNAAIVCYSCVVVAVEQRLYCRARPTVLDCPDTLKLSTAVGMFFLGKNTAILFCCLCLEMRKLLSLFFGCRCPYNREESQEFSSPPTTKIVIPLIFEKDRSKWTHL